MKNLFQKIPGVFLVFIALTFQSIHTQAQSSKPTFKVIAFFTGRNDISHISFVKEAHVWFKEQANKLNFQYDSTSNWDNMNAAFLKAYKVVIFLDTRPEKANQRNAFEHYMKNGGAFMGFHFAGFALNNSDFPQNWDWYHKEFLGVDEYKSNTWRPVPAILQIAETTHPTLKGLPKTFKSAPSEWYRWTGDLYTNKDIEILLSIHPSSFPLGTGPKPYEIWHEGNYPIAWTNKNYKMVYMNMGHNNMDYHATDTTLSSTFSSEEQNKFILNSLEWLGNDTSLIKVPVKEPRAQLQDVIIHINQVAFDESAPKQAVVETADTLTLPAKFRITNIAGNKTFFEGVVSNDMPAKEWFEGRHFYRADFSSFKEPGTFLLRIKYKKKELSSSPFEVGYQILEKQSIPAVFEFFKHQRANSPEELNADKHLLLYGSNKRVDVHGGWCDASGDVSKYFSHLAYTNFMSPQQTPNVVWSMVNSIETAGSVIKDIKDNSAFTAEALYGADYLVRSLSPEGYFYMTIFSYFKKDPEERRIVGLLADSKTTSDYQCAYREGAGMAIAALARIAQWKQNGEFTSEQYISAAKRAFKHVEINNLKYDDDGKENIIDDYCALMAATELWIATGEDVYKTAARKRAKHLAGRMSTTGYFISNDADRPFWHAADAGLPVIALARYLDKENDVKLRSAALNTIKQFIDYQLRVTGDVSNPFGYARQSFKFRGNIKEGFFIPHENESGWWWQGENARLASLATVAIVGGRLVYPGDGAFGIKPELATFAVNQINWILGGNPYDICFMYQHGQNNTPYMASLFGHGSGAGGIGNGITGKDGSPDGTGIDFKMEANGNEWRWTEQWIPHSAWFLQAVSAMAGGKH